MHQKGVFFPPSSSFKLPPAAMTMTLIIYLAPFLIIGIVVTRWMARRGVGLADVRSEGSPHRRRSLFLLGIWRQDEPE